jgi:hypothetical protein
VILEMNEEVIKKAIVFGYELGCRAAEGGYQDSPDTEAEERLVEFLETLTEKE